MAADMRACMLLISTKTGVTRKGLSQGVLGVLKVKD